MAKPTLITNRYGQKTPTVIHDSGVSISSPIYVQLTAGQNKAILNEGREIKRRQLMEMGFNNEPRTIGQMSVKTVEHQPLSPIEEELGLDENNLRYALFNRQGINERLAIKIQRLTGLQLVDRSQIEDLQRQWLDHLFPTDERPKTKRAYKKSSSTPSKGSTSKSSTES